MIIFHDDNMNLFLFMHILTGPLVVQIWKLNFLEYKHFPIYLTFQEPLACFVHRMNDGQLLSPPDRLGIQ